MTAAAVPEAAVAEVAEVTGRQVPDSRCTRWAPAPAPVTEHAPARLLVRWPPGSGAEGNQYGPKIECRAEPRSMPFMAYTGARRPDAQLVDPLLRLLEPVEVQMTGDGQQSNCSVVIVPCACCGICRHL